MKIAVLFGSFNPMTNAHIAMMKTAVSGLKADKGLFVVTNGQYLRRKTVKIGDPFYLTEEERKQIVEDACASEEKLEFWGFEMGGISPKRYKTLKRIQKENPDAEIYEIQGADKVHTISKFGDAEEYVTHVRFAVFERQGIDLLQLLDSDPLLRQHKDKFVLLPGLEDISEVSSTEVRKRFYAGEEYADLVPGAAVAILNRHTPSDFTISYEERMKTIIRSGRFGVRQACKEVYKDNAAMFQSWQAGNHGDIFGDRQTFLDGTKLYTKGYSVTDLGTVYPETKTGCINSDCVDVARHLLDMGYHPAILNLASAKSPGGGYHNGYSAQEESLCQSSNLSLSLYQFGNPKYKYIRESGVTTKPGGYPLDRNYGGIYTPNVTFFRNGQSKFFTLREKPFQCDVITVAALSFNGREEFCEGDETVFRSVSGDFTAEGNEIMLNKIRTIFRLGVEHGKDALILGAFGCGAYRLPVASVVRQFRQVMDEPEFHGKFRLLVFAIMESTRRPNGVNGKFADFYREFGSYSM